MVAVGSEPNGGSIGYSDDGITWTKATTDFFIEGRGVACNGTRWVAVGDGPNTIGYSDNGITWKPATNIFGVGRGRCVAWNGTIWVAAGDNSDKNIAYSNDGKTWTLATINIQIYLVDFNGVASDGTKWVAVGNGPTLNGGYIAYSDDGKTWTKAITNLLSSNFTSVAWNGTIWVAVGGPYVAYSDDGINWTEVQINLLNFTNTHFTSVAWNGTRWVAVGSKFIVYSDDGIYWTEAEVPINWGYGRGVAWNGTRWVAVCEERNTTIAYSDDGKTWTEATNFFTGHGAVCRGVASNFLTLQLRKLYCNSVTGEFTYYS